MSDDSVVDVDFGMEKRRHARILGELLGMAEERDREIVADPIKFWTQAGEEIMRLHAYIDELREAAYPPPPELMCFRDAGAPTPNIDSVVVFRKDFEALRRVRAILERST